MSLTILIVFRSGSHSHAISLGQFSLSLVYQVRFWKCIYLTSTMVLMSLLNNRGRGLPQGPLKCCSKLFLKMDQLFLTMIKFPYSCREKQTTLPGFFVLNYFRIGPAALTMITCKLHVVPIYVKEKLTPSPGHICAKLFSNELV